MIGKLVFTTLLVWSQILSASGSAPAPTYSKPGPPPLPAYTPAPHIVPHGQTPRAPHPQHISPSPYPAYGYSYPNHYGYPYGPSSPAAPVVAAAEAHTYGDEYSRPKPSYGVPYNPYSQKPVEDQYTTPKCARNTTRTWCLGDLEYPTQAIQQAIEYHYAGVASLYKDVIANTDNSVDRLKYLSEETYLCPSYSAYEMPLRAVNTQGKWRIIVNKVKAHYETLSQTVRIEECSTPGHQCPLVPECYDTKCVQKYVYHRFLVYNPYDQYFPFAMESFKLPSSCACFNGDYMTHH